jgi:DNA (cytosine-5)-methyltransferase 1
MYVLDLFSGIGGFSLGLERAGMKTVAFCEIDPYCRKILAKHWPAVKIHDNIKQLDGKQYVGTIDVICGGFPCQDLSTAGRQAGISGKRSGLWGELHRIIGEVRPRYAIVENVTNLLAGERGAWFGRVLADLASLGYDAEWHCIPASYVGAPHRRDRVWIVAYPQCERLPRPWRCEQSSNTAAFPYREAERLVSAFQRNTLPFMCRGHDGVPSGMAKLAAHALGNAVMPQLAKIIGRSIIEYERQLAMAA